MTGLTFSTAKELIQDPYACFRLVTAKKYMALLPKYIGDLNKGVKEQLNAELNLYSPVLNGVMVAYSNVRRFQHHGTILGSQPFLHIYIQADFIVFQPNDGSILRGVINKVGKDYVGCLVHGCFNASVPMRSLRDLNIPNGELSVGEIFLFQVVKYFANNRIMSIRGSFCEDSFSETPILDTVNHKITFDEVDADVEEELPNITHKKRRRSESKNTDTLTTTESRPLFTQPAEFAAAISSLHDEETPSPKKKKKKHRHETADTPPVVEPAENNNVNDQSSIDDSGIMVNTPEVSDTETTKKKKKKKRDKRKSDVEAPQNDNIQDINTSVPLEEGNSLHDSVHTKKKKKKDKRKSEDNSTMEDISINLSVELTETNSLDDTVSHKKKKKKHKHTDE